ncbi:MAG: hypothetical protein E6K96_09380 [Thaumarchaeota archaeon]|nr:MAG: hypothetical protein E6K96_09380 [Nitrososphaerota archaeon]
MKVYELVRRLVDAKGFTGVAALTNELKTTGLTLPSRHTIRLWALAKTSPFSGKRIFNAQPSEELSFFLGAWIGDGWSDENDGGKRMLLKVRSYDFAKEFATSAAKILGKTDSYWVRRIADETGMWYLVKVTSFMLYDFVNRPFEALRAYIECYPKEFLRGFFTAEGNPSVSIERTNGPKLQVGVVVSNSDYKLLLFTRNLLSILGFHPGHIRLNVPEGTKTNLGVARSSGWLLSLSRFEDARGFSSSIGFADGDKQCKIREAISFIENCGHRGAAIEWTKYYQKDGRKWVKKRRGPISS